MKFMFKAKLHKGNTLLKPLYAFFLLAVIFITALILRLYPVIHAPETFNKGFGFFGDSGLYHSIGYNLYKGNGFSGSNNALAFGFKTEGVKLEYEPAAVRAPVYPFFISAVYRFFCSDEDMKSLEVWHKNWDKVRIVQCFLDAIVCVLVFFISRTIFNGTFFPALISSGLYCFSFYNIFYTRALLTESVTTFLLAVFLLLCVLAIKRDKLYLWGMAGLSCGLVVLTRPEYLLFPAVFMFYMVFINRKQILSAAKKILVFFITAAVVVMPWTIRNYHEFKEFIPVSVGCVGFNMFLGTFESNNDWLGWIKDLPDSAFDTKEEKLRAQLLFSSYLATFPTGSIKVKDLDDSLKDLAIKRIKKYPFECLKRWVTAVPRLWYQFYKPMYLKKEASGWFFVFYFIFALCGLWKSTKEERALMAPVCLLFIYLNLVLLPLFIEPRYGVPLMPGIICVASMGIWKISRSLLCAEGENK
ncbi:MAG: glycosyltransferase family 39 protein [Candidatus Omnitrophica bacterium]|nr:glycosyltransferase family 39 protein [Candidatus Omnitrophota bacterium]